MKIALVNNFSNNKSYVKGKVYTDEEVAHLDQSDFEDVDVKEVKKEKNVELTEEIIEAPKKKSRKTK